jgi:putative ABC transport system permease protein
VAILGLAVRSLLNRRVTAALTVLSIALSVMLLLGVERLRNEAREGFANTISGTDLIVGARGSPVSLLLYSVFRIGNATNNISWQSYQELSKLPQVRWAVPLSLGDSHAGYRVLGTTPEYFEFYRHGAGRSLVFAEGGVFRDVYDAVLGADVARALGYRVGQSLVVAHGAGKVSFVDHADKPFRVAGILAKTGTPVDQTIHVSLQGIEAIHLGWESGTPSGAAPVPAEAARALDLTPRQITAFLVGLKSRAAVFQVQRRVSDYLEEPLTAILPGVALQELWQLIGMAERALLVVSGFVVLVGFFGMLTALLTSLTERRREMAILRSVGARPVHVFGLVLGEALALVLAGVAVGLALLYGAMLLARPWLESEFGLAPSLGPPSAGEWGLLAAVVVAGALASLVPSYRAYRMSLADGMTIRT